ARDPMRRAGATPVAIVCLSVVCVVAGAAAVVSAHAGRAAAACVGSWRDIPSPLLSGSLAAVAATSADDAWAVGGGPLIEHWDGRAWSVVQTPRVRGGSLTAVAALSGDDAWAVGSWHEGALVLHWDGRAWSRVAAPGSLVGVSAIAAITPGDIWIAGGSDKK